MNEINICMKYILYNYKITNTKAQFRGNSGVLCTLRFKINLLNLTCLYIEKIYGNQMEENDKY